MTRRGADAGLTDAPQEHRVRTWAGRAPGPVSLPVTPGLEPPERTTVPCLGLLFDGGVVRPRGGDRRAGYVAHLGLT